MLRQQRCVSDNWGKWVALMRRADEVLISRVTCAASSKQHNWAALLNAWQDPWSETWWLLITIHYLLMRFIPLMIECNAGTMFCVCSHYSMSSLDLQAGRNIPAFDWQAPGHDRREVYVLFQRCILRHLLLFVWRVGFHTRQQADKSNLFSVEIV